MSNIRSRMLVVLLMSGFVLSSGCGGGTDTTETEYVKNLVSVSGNVTLEGNPVPQAKVLFLPDISQESGRMAEGYTDGQGRYQLNTPVPSLNRDRTAGVLPGEYRVVISKITMPDGSPIPQGTTEADAMAEGAQESIPARYSDPNNTELKVTIAAAQQDLDFEL